MSSWISRADFDEFTRASKKQMAEDSSCIFVRLTLACASSNLAHYASLRYAVRLSGSVLRK